MSLDSILGLIQTALELGLISSLTVLALFLSYSMLGVCDLSTDGCFTLGATVGAAIAIAGHPYLSIPAAMLAGMLSGLVTAVLQTKMGVNSLLSGIIVNTALYSVNSVLFFLLTFIQQPELSEYNLFFLELVFACPVLLVLLPGARNGKRHRGNVVGDGRPRGNIRALSHAHGRDEIGVAADEGVVFNDGAVFF